MGGSYQYNKLISLFDNYDKVQKFTAIANNSEGAAEGKFANYTESLEAKTKSLQASLEALASDTLSSEMYAGFLDAAKGMADFAKETDLVKTALAGLGTAGATYAFTQLSTMLSNTITQVSNLGGGLKGLWGVLSAHPVALVTAGVTAAIGAWNAYQKSVQESVNSAKQAASEWEESNSSIQSNIEKITELRTALDSGKLTEQEAYDTKSQLLDIQNQLSESYGNQVEGIDLVNGSLDEQIAKLNELADAQANKLLNENQTGIKKATKEMEKERHTYLGQFSPYEQDADKLQSIIDEYKDKGIYTDADMDGTVYVHFKGDATQANEVLNNFMTDFRTAADETDNTDLFDGFSQNASIGLSEANDVLKEYQGLYNQAMKADLQTDKTDFGGKKAAEWLNNYSTAVEKYNDAVANGSTEEVANAKDYYNKINQSVQGLLKGSDMSQYSALFDDVLGQLDKAAIKVNEFNAALNSDGTDSKFLNGYQKHIQSVVDDIQKLDMSDADFEAAINIGDIDSINYLSKAAEKAGISTDALVSSLVNLGVLSGNPSDTVEEVSSNVDSFRTSVESAIESQNDLKSAFESSRSATGLTAEEIEKVTDAYKDLDGFDPSTLFENTANGVHLNTDAMKLLNEQLEATTKQGYLEQIAAKQKEINDLLSENPQADVSGLEAELATLEQLSAQYDAATSAYNNFINAQSGGNERDSYENVAKSYESMKEILSEGWFGDKSLNSYLDLMLSASKRTGDAQADFKKLTQTIEGTSNSLMDYFVFDKDNKLVTDGLFDFLDDVNSKLGDEYAKIGENGYEFDFNGDKLQEVADAFGTTPEMIQLFERAMIDAGMAVELGGNELDDYASKMDELTQKTDAAKEKLKEMQKDGSGKISSSLDLDYNAAEMSLDEVKSKIEELKQERITVEASGDTEGLQAIDDEISALENQSVTMSIQAQVDSGTSIDELFSMEDEQLSATLSIDTSQVDDARKQLESLNGETAEASVSVNQPKQATVKVTPEQEEIEVKVKDATVKVTPDPEEVEVSVKDASVEVTAKNKSVDINANVTGKENVDGLNTSIQNLSGKTVEANAEVEGTDDTYGLKAAIDSLYPRTVQEMANVFGTSEVQNLASSIASLHDKSVTVTTNFVTNGEKFSGSSNDYATGTMLSPAHASGTAYNVLNMKPISAFASGKVTLPQNERALVNEEEVNGHSESIVRDGKWFLIPGGAHFENLKKGDLIFSAQQTDDLLKHGKIAGHARTYASGTIGNWFSNAYDSGTGGNRRPSSGVNTHTAASSTPKKLNQAASNLDSASQSIAKSGDSLSDLIKKISDNVQDWIEVLISRTESKIEYYQAVYENRKSIKSKNANLNKAEDFTGKEVKYYKEAYKKYLSYADNVASQVGLSADLKKKVQEGRVDIQQLSEDDKNRVDAYMEWFNKAINARKAAEEKLTEQAEIAAKKLETITDIYDSYIDRTKAKQDLNDAKLEYREIAGMSIHESSGYYPIMKQQIAYEKSNIAMLKKEAKEYEKQLKAYGKKYGTNSKEYRELETTLIGVNQKYYESKTNLEKLNQQVREAKEQLKQWAVDIRGRAADKQAAARSYKQTADGYSVTEKDYTEQIKINNHQIDSLYALREEKAKNMELYSYNSDLYQEYADEIAQIDIEIMNLAEDSEEAKNAIMSLRWEPFYEAQEALDGVVNEYDTLRGLMDSDTFISDANGAFTENGLTNILLLQESMDATKSKIANYRAQIENLNEQYKNGCWSQEEYNEKLKELHDSLLDSATAMADYKQEMLDMYEAQLEKKNELMHEDIDAYQQALEAKKKYHDYDKKLKSQTKELNILKAQAAALEGVSDAASKAKLAQIKAQIAEQEEALEDTKYEHEYELKSDGFDKLGNDIDKNLDKALDSLRTNADMQNQVIDGMLSNVTTSYESTFANLDKIVQEHGLMMSDTFSNTISSLDAEIRKLAESTGNIRDELSNLYNTGDVQDTKADSSVQNSNNKGIPVTSSSTTPIVKDTVDKSDTASEASTGAGSGIKYVRATKAKMSKSSISLYVGKTYKLKATVEPEGAAANFDWESSDTKIAKVSSSGVVTAVAKGSTTITAKEHRSNKVAKCKVTVKEPKKPTTDKNKQPASQPTKPTSNKPTSNTSKTNIWSGVAKDTSMKGNKSLNIVQSIVDRMQYNGYSSSKAARTQLWKNLKGSGNYFGTASQNVWMLEQLKKVGYSDGGIIDRYIKVDPNSEAGKYVYQNKDNAIVTARAGEYILPEDMAKRTAPTVRTMETFNDNIRKYASYSNSNSRFVAHYDSLITVNGNVDKDVMGDLKKLSKELINNRNFVNGMTDKISTNLTNDMSKSGFIRKIR